MDARRLIADLQAARERTRHVADDLGGERELGPKLPIVNPPRWEVGHVGWFQEWWCLRGASESRPSILPNADRLYNSASVAHDTRWSLPLPSFADTLAYRDQVLARLVDRLNSGADDKAAYFAGLAARHEEMHAEAFSYTRQTLGYPAPTGQGSLQARSADGEDAELPGGAFSMGAKSDAEFAFDNEKWIERITLQRPGHVLLREQITIGGETEVHAQAAGQLQRLE